MKNTIGQILVEKLTKEEFSKLCEEWDDGSFDNWMREQGLEIDQKNYPEKYKWEVNEEVDTKEDIDLKIPINFTFGQLD